jgi:general secretion pathway protein K
MIWDARGVKSKEGSALIAVVFVLLIAAAIAGSLIGGARSDLQLSSNYELQLENELASEAGIAAAILSLSDPGARPSLIANGQGFTLSAGKKQLRVSIANEAGKINLNRTPNPLLRRLLQTVCPDDSGALELWSAIEAALARTKEGEKTFLTVEEIGRLPGASAKLLAAIEPYVSVYSFRDVPDFGLAPSKLQALMSEGGNATGLAAAQSRSPTNSGAASGVFTISASAAGSAASAPIEAVVYVTGDPARPYRILEWRQKAWTDKADCLG